MPDTFDVDTLFADLQHDVERITRGPGAHDAIRTSQRRARSPARRRTSPANSCSAIRSMRASINSPGR